MPILGCKMPILGVIKLASHRAKRKAKWCKTRPNAQIWTEQNGHKSTIQPLNVWFKTAICARMERRKRVSCKIYLPNLGYPKNLPTNFLLPPYCLPSYYLLLTTAPLTSYYPTNYSSTTCTIFFDNQPRFATHKWGINPKFIITLPCTSVHERSVYLGFASQRYHTPLNFRPAPHIAFGVLTKHKGKYNLAKSSKQGTSSNGRTNKPYKLKAKEKR